MSSDKILTAIARLIDQTQDSQLKWQGQACKPTDDIVAGKEILVDIVYQAEKDDRLIRLYEYKYRHYVDEDEYFWSRDIALELSDVTKKSWWRFPSHSAIKDLFEAVQFQIVGADQFIKNLISDKDLPF
jgi:hypothetical protein